MIVKIMVKLLVSPTDEIDALDAVKGGADIIDVKNPAEGSLGAPLPILIRKIRKSVPRNIPISAALGDVPMLPGTIAQAALGAAMAGADYVKIGLMGPKNVDDAISIVEALVNTLTEFYPDVITVAALYADYERVGTLNPMELPRITEEANANFAMIDTAIKDDKNLFEFITKLDIESFLQDCRDRKIRTALAGSLSDQAFETAIELRPDVVGVRKAVLLGSNRITARINRDAVEKLKNLVSAIK
jgi:uncharacterized protein (UPF0264 family)